MIRELVREVTLSRTDLVQPVFVEENLESDLPIVSMPGQRRFALQSVQREVGSLKNCGIRAVLLFGIPVQKDETGSSAYEPAGIVQSAVRLIKDEYGDEIAVFTDVCMCQYTTHGHCGIIREGKLENEETRETLGKIALSHAQAGADMVAPSAMIDGQVGGIRDVLDANGFKDVGIIGYSAKHASSFFGPFRDAAFSTPKFGDRRTYQMDIANPEEALREVQLDIAEGVDMVMVKPALPYLDIIRRVKERFRVPTAAYNVSGEYSMIKAAAREGWLDEKSTVLEVLTGIKRAGADLIITYHAKEAAEWLRPD